MLVGHQEVTKALSQRLPPVSIITGPPSVGKKLIATYAAISHNIPRVDFIQVTKLTVDEAKRIKMFMETAPCIRYKYALVELDEATKPAMDDLLKILEEPPTYARFSLVSSENIPRTLQTRGYKYRVGLLKSNELQEILVRKGLPEQEARKLNKLGRVDIALATYYDVATRTAALNVLSAVESGDYDLFCQAYKAVDHKVADFIINILQESASGQWKLTNPQYLGSFAKKQVALKLLAIWSPVSQARSKLAVRVMLESVMRG